MKLKELTKKVKKEIKENCLNVDRVNYSVGTTYDYKVEGRLIKITLPGVGSEGIKNRTTDRIFKSIINTVCAEGVDEVITWDLGWEDSLRRLFTHYKFGRDYNSNSICVNGAGQIIGVQYNGCKTTTIIKSEGCPIGKDFVVVNSEIKLKGYYSISDSEEIIDYIATYFKTLENKNGI